MRDKRKPDRKSDSKFSIGVSGLEIDASRSVGRLSEVFARFHFWIGISRSEPIGIRNWEQQEGFFSEMICTFFLLLFWNILNSKKHVSIFLKRNFLCTFQVFFFLFLLILSTDNYFNIFLQTLDKKDNKKMKKCVQWTKKKTCFLSKSRQIECVLYPLCHVPFSCYFDRSFTVTKTLSIIYWHKSRLIRFCSVRHG